MYRRLTRLRIPCQQQRSLTGLVLTGSYADADSTDLQLSAAAAHFDKLSGSSLSRLAGLSRIKKCRTFYGLHEEYPVVTLSVVDKIKEDSSSRDNDAEAVRAAVGAGVSALSAAESGLTEILVDSASNAHAASEAAQLSVYKFDALKTKKEPRVVVSQCELEKLPGACNSAWACGSHTAQAQNLARYLMEMPANHMTPALFVETIQDEIARTGSKVSAVVRDKAWITEQKMGAFLSVSLGSTQPPYFLELHYAGADSDPVCLVGKGVTFDTGGISIKPSKGMDAMRADMGGAACAASATLGAAALQLPINLVTLIPLCENMPSGCATKPGDVVTAMNGTTIQVDNTDAEGRLILADALCYADTFNPTHVIDMATLTGAMAIALGSEAVGTYSTCDDLWSALERAGHASGDRLWRMPLFKEYGDLLKSRTADVNNISAAPYGGSITAAKFLQRFTKCSKWAHLDIAGVMDSTDSMSYLPKGMSGRPTRTVIQALRLLANDL